MTQKRIRISYEIITPESAEQGDVEERGWVEEEGIAVDPDEWDREITEVYKTAIFLQDVGATEASSSHFHPGIWYTAYGEMNLQDGSYKNLNYHLVGFTEEEEEEIYRRIMRK